MERPAFIRLPKNRVPDYQVTLGTPSEGELRRGDVVVRIGNKDAAKLSHQEAHNLIKNAGNNLQFVVNRSQYPQSPDAYGPRPLATLAAHASHGRMDTMPRSNYNPYGTIRRYVPPAPPNAPASQDDDQFEIDRERIAISSQPHRTFPLIQPGVKVKHDLPTGSYLRHVNDPFVRAGPHPTVKQHPMIQHANEALMKARIQESVTSAASNSSGIGSPRGRSETPDSGSVPFIIHRQYNSPIDMYSAQNVAASIAGQTGVQIAPAPNPIRYVDITKSPTYRTIYENEWKKMDKSELREHLPVQDKIKSLPTRPSGHHSSNNAFGAPHNRVIQSRAFEMISDILTSDF